MNTLIKTIVVGGIWTLIASFALLGCGEMEVASLDQSASALQPNEAARQARLTLDDDARLNDVRRLAVDDVMATHDGDVDYHRIEVRMAVRTEGSRLALDVDFYNPADCHWFGQLFFEHEHPPTIDSVSAVPRVETLARYYRVWIPSGAHVRGTLYTQRPTEPGPHRFLARAYHDDGGDREPFFNCVISEDGATDTACPVVDDGDATAPELVLAEGVEGVLEGVDPTAADLADLEPCAEHTPPIFADLRLRFEPGRILAVTRWYNRFPTPWWGDLYVDMVTPTLDVRIMRRSLDVAVEPETGFRTLDRIRFPQEPGLYWFNARALRRDGSAEVRWLDPGTTEIVAVCNGFVCERIEPEQERATLTLRGDSAIHLESDFFSEHTRVTLATEDAIFDITDLCRIRQYPDPAGLGNHIGVYFNARRLPVGPSTMAQYTIMLHPMPIVPEGAKLQDSLWIRTDGGWCESCLDAASD